MGRAERVILFGAGFLFGRVTAMLWIMAILTWVTVFQRFWKTWQQLGSEPTEAVFLMPVATRVRIRRLGCITSTLLQRMSPNPCVLECPTG